MRKICTSGSVRGVEAGCRVRCCGTLGTERQEQRRTQTLPNQQGYSTSTRPISRLRISDCGLRIGDKPAAPGSRGAKSAKRSQFAPGETARTMARPNRAKRTQFGPGIQAPAGPNVRNEPNSRRGGWDGASGTRDECAKRSQLPAPAGAVHGRRRGRCFQRSQLCKTNPIWPGRGRARSP